MIIKFEKEAVKNYLDEGIQCWRYQRTKALKQKNDRVATQAMNYIDAFQSVRRSLFDEVLPLDIQTRKKKNDKQ